MIEWNVCTMQVDYRNFVERYLKEESRKNHIFSCTEMKKVATLEEVIIRHINHTLEHFENNKSRTAQVLGVSRNTIRKYIER